MDDLVVRPAQHGDIDELTELMYAYIVDFYQRPKPPVEKLHALIGMLLFKQQGIQFVAWQNGKLVGFATLYFTFSTLRTDKIAVMNDLYVAEEVRGTGVAASLFEACHTYATENGYAHMSWVTADDNRRAQRFYAKMGGQAADWINYSIPTTNKQ
jgi:GNAT superfamily N-acetyltransferase